MKLGSKESIRKSKIELAIVIILTVMLLVSLLFGLRVFLITVIIVYPIDWMSKLILIEVFSKYDEKDIIINKKFCFKHEWIAQFYEDVDWLNAPLKNFVCTKCWKKITPQEWKDKKYKDSQGLVENIKLKNGEYYVQ